MLLAGPRGRRLCWELLLHSGWGFREPASEGDAAELSAVTEQAAAGDAMRDLAAMHDPGDLINDLSFTVAAAMYWQEPDVWDRWLAHPDLREQLRPVAEAVCAAPAAAWWSDAIDDDTQQEAIFIESIDDPMTPSTEDGRSTLARLRAGTIERERDSAARPEDSSGAWWSCPAHTGLTRTTRTAPGHGPVGLYVVEDALNWEGAWCKPLRPRPHASVYEIHSPEDWTELVRRYPLVVTNSRGPDWCRATGRSGSWTIPDFAAVAADHDAVHLTVLGYLSTAGRALDVGDEATVLAGWDPDQTWWLTDRPVPRSSAVRWSCDGGTGLEDWAPLARD